MLRRKQRGLTTPAVQTRRASPRVTVRNRMTKTPTKGNEGIDQTGQRYAESEGLELST